MTRNIGIIDSGIGGLTVLQNLLTEFPNKNYIYVGDNKNCPYGDKKKSELLFYTSKIIDYFIRRNVHLVVVACNTINSNIMNDLIKRYPNIEFIGIIKETVKQLIDINSNSCLIIGTTKTIESHYYEKEIKKLKKKINIYTKATPLLVPMIENNNYNLKETVEYYLNEYKYKIDTIILGCTHYPIISKEIKSVLGNINLVSSSDGIILAIRKYLVNKNRNKGKVEIYTTGDVSMFIAASQSFFDYQNIEVGKLILK